MAYKPKCDSAGCDGWGAVSLLLVVFGLLIATSQPLLGRGNRAATAPPFTAVLWRRVQGKRDLSSKPVVNCVLPASFPCVSQGQICYLWIKEAITLLLGSELGLPCYLVLEALDWVLHYQQEKYQHSVFSNSSFSHVVCLLIHIYI